MKSQAAVSLNYLVSLACTQSVDSLQETVDQRVESLGARYVEEITAFSPVPEVGLLPSRNAPASSV